MTNKSVFVEVSNYPPVILDVYPDGIDIRTHYHYFGNARSGRNDLVCLAENADDVYWTYKKLAEFQMTRSFPEIMIQGELIDHQNGTLSRNISNHKAIDRFQQGIATERHLVEGYYQCVATNRFHYKTISGIIHLTYAGMYQIAKGRERLNWLPSP